MDQNIIRVSYSDKPRVASMKTIIQNCLQERLTNFVYDGDKSNENSKFIADTIRSRLRDLGYERYKFVVQVLIGERKEQGIRMGTRCFWDSNTDNQASETFMNDSIFCVATAYAIYLY